MKKESMICSFCGRGQPEIKRFIASPLGEAFICEDCIEICSKIVEDDARHFQVQKKVLSPKQIKEYLDEYIVGQEQAKKVLSVAVYNHYKKVEYNKKTKSQKGVVLDKSNILLVGPTGSGKTLLAKTLAKILNVPFAMCDATTLTEAGYVGEDVESVLSKLLQNSGGDVKKAEMGIVYIDEIDKIAKKNENRQLPKDPSGEGVQQALLKIIEGTVASVPIQSNKKTPYQESVSLDTSNILFVCGGAFVGIDDILKDRNKKTELGFSKGKEKLSNFEKQIVPQDLIKFGLIPEFVGRLPVVTQLEKLTNQDLQDILTKPKNSIIKQYQEIMNIDGIAFGASKGAIQEIANQAYNMGDGARGLRTILETNLLDAMYSLPNSDIKSFTLDIDNDKLALIYDEKLKDIENNKSDDVEKKLANIYDKDIEQNKIGANV